MEMLKEMKDKPSISPNSQKIIKKKKNYKSPMQRVKSYKEEVLISLENNEQLKGRFEMEGYIGSPKIDKKSKELFNDANKRLIFEEKQTTKKKDIIKKIVYSTVKIGGG